MVGLIDITDYFAADGLHRRPSILGGAHVWKLLGILCSKGMEKLQFWTGKTANSNVPLKPSGISSAKG